MYGINTLPYYTSTSMTPRGYAHGGIANTRQGYLFGGITRTLSKIIPKEISKTLGKIIPNEIKPFLPYAAAALPFMLPGGFTLAGLSPEISRALASGIASAGSQMAQKDYDKLGLNPLTIGLNAGVGYLSTPGLGNQIGAEKIIGNTPGGTPITPAEYYSAGNVGDITKAAVSEAGYLPPTLTQSATNLGLSAEKLGADYLGKGTTAFEKLTGPGDFSMSDLTSLGKAASPSIAATSSEQAYNAAKLAQMEYDKKQEEMQKTFGSQGVADQSARRAAVIHAMQISGFDQPSIDSALSRLGLADGGVSTMPKFIPMDPESVGLRLFGKNIDNLSYIEKQAVRDYIDDNKNKKADGGLMSLKGNEMDFRDGGGFVPLGKKERADDVPARLSKNEFVFTAKAVRNAGHGDIKAGAKRMYQLMKHLEAR